MYSYEYLYEYCAYDSPSTYQTMDAIQLRIGTSTVVLFWYE